MRKGQASTALHHSPNVLFSPLNVFRFASCLQVNTGLIQTRAARGTPSRSTATSQQVERVVSTRIRSPKGYVWPYISTKENMRKGWEENLHVRINRGGNVCRTQQIRKILCIFYSLLSHTWDQLLYS